MKKAVVDAVAGFSGWDADTVRIVGAGGKPDPNCGNWFLGVWGGPRQWLMKTAASAGMSINLTMTMRFNGPMDRWGEGLDELEEGFDERMDALCSALFAAQNTIRAAADVLMPSGKKGFVRAPRPISDPEPQQVRADWFNAEAGKGIGDGLVYGFAATLVYGDWTFDHPVSSAAL